MKLVPNSDPILLTKSDCVGASRTRLADRSRSKTVDCVFCGWLPRCKCDLMIWRIGRVQSSVRPVNAVGKETAGPDGVRERGPILLIRL